MPVDFGDGAGHGSGSSDGFGHGFGNGFGLAKNREFLFKQEWVIIRENTKHN